MGSRHTIVFSQISENQREPVTSARSHYHWCSHFDTTQEKTLSLRVFCFIIFYLLRVAPWRWADNRGSATFTRDVDATTGTASAHVQHFQPGLGEVWHSVEVPPPT